MKKILLILLIPVLAGVGVYFYNQRDKTDDKTTEQVKAVEQATDTKQKVEQQAKPTPKKAVAEQSTPAVTVNPAIWSINYQGKTSYLFGSIHGGDKSLYPLPEKIMQAFANSDSLAVEIDLSKVNQAEMGQLVQKLGIDMENPLPTMLSETTRLKYDEYCKATKLPCQTFNIFEPWMAAITLEAMAFMQAGYSEAFGIDKHFVDKAKDKEIIELESIESQLNMLDQMPVKLQDLMVLGAVSKDKNDFEELMTAWKTGQLDSIMEKAEQESLAMGIDPQDIEDLNEIFLFKRNQQMADGIADIMKSGKSVFAVVGAAHYSGERSVIDYLEQLGFEVKKF